jgi:hypothetical protein
MIPKRTVRVDKGGRGGWSGGSRDGVWWWSTTHGSSFRRNNLICAEVKAFGAWVWSLCHGSCARWFFGRWLGRRLLWVVLGWSWRVVNCGGFRCFWVVLGCFFVVDEKENHWVIVVEGQWTVGLVPVGVAGTSVDQLVLLVFGPWGCFGLWVLGWCCIFCRLQIRCARNDRSAESSMGTLFSSSPLSTWRHRWWKWI